MNENQAESVELSAPGVDRLREEVGGDQTLHVGGDELSPRHGRLATLVLLRCWMDALIKQDTLDGGSADGVTELLQFPDDPSVA
jgi:hypothetical protein